jgi:hypothetical protein
MSIEDGGWRAKVEADRADNMREIIFPDVNRPYRVKYRRGWEDYKTGWGMYRPQEYQYVDIIVDGGGVTYEERCDVIFEEPIPDIH